MREDPEIARWKDIRTKLAEFFFPMWWDLPKDHELKLEINDVIEKEFERRHEIEQENETPAGERKRRGGRKKKRKTRKRKGKSKKKKSKKKTRKKRKTKRKNGGKTITASTTTKEQGKKLENKTIPEPAQENPTPAEEPAEEPAQEPTQEQVVEPTQEPLAEKNVPAQYDIAATQANPMELYQEIVDVLQIPNIDADTIGDMISNFLNNMNNEGKLNTVTGEQITNYIFSELEKQSSIP